MIKEIRYILPLMMALLTRQPRYLPNIQWSSQSWTHNVFRVYEMIFWRRWGIKAEMTTNGWVDENGVQHTEHFCHSWESVFALTETYIRDALTNLKPRPFRVYIPRLMTPQGFSIPASPYLFAIALDAVDAAWADGVAPTNTFSHTCTGSNRILFVGVVTTLETFTSATYATVGMTEIVRKFAGSNNWVYLNDLVAPATGANDVVLTATGTIGLFGVGISYSGAAQTGQPDASGSASGTGGTGTGTVTVVATGSWLVMAQVNNANQPTAGSGTTLRRDGTGVTSGGIFDSNGAPGTGSQSLIANTVNQGAQWAVVIASFAPAAAAAATGRPNNLLLMGVS